MNNIQRQLVGRKVKIKETGQIGKVIQVAPDGTINKVLVKDKIINTIDKVVVYVGWFSRFLNALRSLLSN